MKKKRVYVYAICKNEAKFAERWAKSMSEADGVFALDTGSDDDTVKILQGNGVTVHQAILSPWRFDRARNLALEMVPEDGDICVSTDLDEIFHPGWRKALEEAWIPGTQRARYRYTWNFLEDGSEGVVFYADKIHARHGFHWVNPVHEVLQYKKDRYTCVTVPGIQLDHHADSEKSRSSYLPLLELAVQEQPGDDRSRHYLGREYMYHGLYDKAIKTLKEHLQMPSAVWDDERAASMRYIGKCCEAMGNAPEAERWYLRAEAEAPWLREPWMDEALFRYRRKEWHALIFCCERALTITDRGETYITEAAPWGALPYDLAALGYYYTDNLPLAERMIDKAIALAPKDPRLQNNKALIHSAVP